MSRGVVGCSVWGERGWSEEACAVNITVPLYVFVCVKAKNPFEEEENVDSRFVEEIALKQTLIKLGFERK